eukprot:CAMPEP_0176095264 /NCGR_PEP_ID=MMETSP0120_2-20121206/47747_1 /TAXON_ID=160619 /ORGANISM="Kryptoperidinium foliaceum, Strain CCMP 1326" /LENGTH=235 /DNA_ID=CAMNT_0017429227 /DNA_START=223 /DNA_END=930 /DNA_ORIENTATION=+
MLSPDRPGFVVTASRLYKLGRARRFYRCLGISLALAINPALASMLATSFLRLLASAGVSAGQDVGNELVGFAIVAGKLFATLVTYPLIRAKVLQQTALPGGQHALMQIWREILRLEGWAGLWRGVLAMSARAMLWNAFMMAMPSSFGWSRSVATPSATPPPITPPRSDSLDTWMGRDAWTSDFVANRLDEVLCQVGGGAPLAKRVDRVEDGLERMHNDMLEVKRMLLQVARAKTS